MNPGTFLPQELIDKFIDDLWFERDTDALKTLSQTSRLFLHRCRRHLFAHIHLSSGTSTGQSQRIARKAKNLDEILVKVPEIANYVQKMFFTVSNFNNAEVHIVSQLLLRFSMINKLSLSGPCDWALVAPELQSVISRLASSPRMKTFSLWSIHNFPVSFFASCTNLIELSIDSCVLEDHSPLGNAETGFIARLHDLTFSGTSVGLEKLICGTRGQDGSPILDFSHLQELTADLPSQEALPPLREILKRATKLISLVLNLGMQLNVRLLCFSRSGFMCYLLVDEELSLNGVFQPSSSFKSLRCLWLRLSIYNIEPEDPLFGLCHELRRIERSNSLEEILIKVSSFLRLQQDFLADLNDVLTLPGYTKLRCLHLEIILRFETIEEYDRVEESRQELNNAAQQLFNRPSLKFSYLVAVKGIDDDDDIFG